MSDDHFVFPGLTGIAASANLFIEALRPLQAQLEEFGRRMEAAYPRLTEDARELGRRGWTVPMWADFRLISDLVRDTSPDEVDEFFVAWYKGPRSASSKELIQHILDEPLVEPWTDVIKQSWSAYRSGLVLVAVPALLAVLEGVLATAAGQIQKWPRPLEHSQSLLDSKSEGSIGKVVLFSIDSFVRDLYDRSDFSAPAPSRINRHWILHGRDFGSWTKADALRLYQALTSLAAVARPAPAA